MDTFLTLVIAIGGIATGIGASWTAIGPRTIPTSEEAIHDARENHYMDAVGSVNRSRSSLASSRL
jgi:hypothetical protein